MQLSWEQRHDSIPEATLEATGEAAAAERLCLTD